MSSGGRKRSNSGASSSAKRGKSPGKKAVAGKRSQKYKTKYPKTIFLPITGPTGSIGPQRIKTQLVYAGGPYQATTNVGFTFAPVTFRLNSIYDPEYAAGGGQPYGMDNLQGLGYRQWMVSACKVEIITAPRGPIGGAIGSHAVSLQPSTNAAQSSVHFPSALMRKWKGKVIPYDVNGTGANGCDTPIGGSKDGYISKFYRIKDVLGRPLDETDDAGYFTNDPVQVCNVSVNADCNPQTSSIAYQFYARLTYYVTFFQPVSVADS